MTNNLKDMTSYFAIIMSCFSFAYSYGVQAQKINNVEVRVANSESRENGIEATMTQILSRLTGIDTRLEITLPYPTRQARR